MVGMSGNVGLRSGPLTAIAHAHMVRGDYEEALAGAKRSLTANASFVCTYWMLAAADAHLGPFGASGCA